MEIRGLSVIKKELVVKIVLYANWFMPPKKPSRSPIQISDSGSRLYYAVFLSEKATNKEAKRSHRIQGDSSI